MTPKSRINCQDVKKILDLEEVESRPDRASMAEHLKECSQCREHAPELAWFYGQFELAAGVQPVRPKRSWRAASFAAAVIIAVTVFGLVDLSRPGAGIVKVPTAQVPPVVSPTRVLPEHFSTVEIRSTQMQPDNAVSSSTADGVGSVGARPQARTHEMEWIR